MHFKYWYLIALVFLLCFACSPNEEDDGGDWCDQAIRAEFLELDEIKTESEWFKVFLVGENVYAIAEPYNFQEVISYLILGTERALLFDSGMGLDSISTVVKELTNLPVTIINSHTHYDHIGGNYEFENILALNTDYTLNWAGKGWSHELVKQEVTREAFCQKMLPNIDTAKYHVKPFTISGFIKDGHLFDLGQRIIEVVTVPGHTPDAMALFDKANGYLWTGDTFYEGPIWLFFEGTNLDAYEKSIERLAALSPALNKVFPAHNTPIAEPLRLIELVGAFNQILDGTKKAKQGGEFGHPDDNTAVVFEFEHFSFLIRRDHLKLKGVSTSLSPVRGGLDKVDN